MLILIQISLSSALISHILYCFVPQPSQQVGKPNSPACLYHFLHPISCKFAGLNFYNKMFDRLWLTVTMVWKIPTSAACQKKNTLHIYIRQRNLFILLYCRLIMNNIIKLNKYSFRLMLHMYIVKDPNNSLHYSIHLMQIFEDCSCHAPALNSHHGIWHQAEDHPYCQYFYNHQILVDLSKPVVPENHGNHPQYKISSLQYAQGYGQTRHIGIL